jgi:hypothetical protein
MGGAGLPFGLMLVGLLVVAVLVGVYVIAPWWRSEEEERKRITDPEHESLVYEVPEGRDPVPIVLALRQEGLEAVEVMRHGRQQVVIGCPSGRDQVRPRARAVIAHEADINLEGDPTAAHGRVTFADE